MTSNGESEPTATLASVAPKSGPPDAVGARCSSMGRESYSKHRPLAAASESEDQRKSAEQSHNMI